MAASFVTRIILPLALGAFLFLYWAAPIDAAAPSASLVVSPDRRYVTLTFTNLKSVKSASYTLTYDTGARQTGFSGRLIASPKTFRSSRRQILGTCSSRRCVFHSNPRNLRLDVDFTLRSGGIVSLSRTLPNP